jgi:hypothetical protein
MVVSAFTFTGVSILGFLSWVHFLRELNFEEKEGCHSRHKGELEQDEFQCVGFHIALLFLVSNRGRP